MRVSELHKVSILYAWRVQLLRSMEELRVRELAGDASIILRKELDVLLGSLYGRNLLSMPVSKVSEFGEDRWDFNRDFPHSARDIRGSKQSISFGTYTSIPALTMIELKSDFLAYFWTPTEVGGGTKLGRKAVKISTVIAVFKVGLAFVDGLFKGCVIKFGEAFIRGGLLPLKNVAQEEYSSAAANFKYAYSIKLDTFFALIRSPFLSENVFGGQIPYVELAALSWAAVSKQKKISDPPQPKLTLPNAVFEKASMIASLNVVDFLDVLGEPVIDQQSLRRRKEKGYSLASSHKLSRKIFDIYTMIRLEKYFTSEEIIGSLYKVLPEFLSSRVEGELVVRNTLYKVADGLINAKFHDYLTYVEESACYIIAQYTGMRPSELAEVLVEESIVERDGKFLIRSHLIKHQDTFAHLFDEWWVAIPIIRDAVSVAKVLSRISKNPFLFSSSHTVPPGKTPISRSSKSLTDLFMDFFSRILKTDEFAELSIHLNNYTLRHTLAYQLFRAEVGLPFISHQLKHFKDLVGGLDPNKSFSEVTLTYGEIGRQLAGGKNNTAETASMLMRQAELEAIKAQFDPDGSFAGVKASDHLASVRKYFNGYMEIGYTKDEIFEQLADQGFGVINVGTGFCYGNETEDLDDSIPCIGSLRCNPVRCHNAVVTKAHASRWREVRDQNKKLLNTPSFVLNKEQILESIKEAELVLEHLGEDYD